MKICGFNAVIESLHAGRVEALFIRDKRHDGLREIIRLAESQRIPVTQLSEKELDRVADGQRHQGVVVSLRPHVMSTISDLVQSSDLPLIVALDGIEDPHNFGAIARVAEAAGAGGLIVQTRRAAPLSAAAVRASAALLAAETKEVLLFPATFKAFVRLVKFELRVPSRYWAANLSALADALIAAVAASDCVSASKCLV